MQRRSGMLLFVLLVLMGALLPGCSIPPDPAVRLARSIERALEFHKGERGPIQATCAFGLVGGCVVVLHPEGDLATGELVAAGLSPGELAAIQNLRLGSEAAIYVLSNDPGTDDSRTTCQRSLVRIPQVMVRTKTASQPLVVRVAGAADDRFIESLR